LKEQQPFIVSEAPQISSMNFTDAFSTAKDPLSGVFKQTGISDRAAGNIICIIWWLSDRWRLLRSSFNQGIIQPGHCTEQQDCR